MRVLCFLTFGDCENNEPNVASVNLFTFAICKRPTLTFLTDYTENRDNSAPAMNSSQTEMSRFVYPLQATWVQLRSLFSLQDDVKVHKCTSQFTISII